MKKSLVALAALAATSAFAQSSVSITGLLDASYHSISGSGTTATTKLNSVSSSVGSATSAINISALEDLGGGMKAQAFYAIDPRAIFNNSTGALGRHEMYVGLSGGFGTIKLGSPNTAALSAHGAGQVFGTATGSAYANLATASGSAVRFNNSVRYDTPAMAGFSASVNYTPGNTDATSGGAAQGATDVGLSYSNGPLNVVYSNLTRTATDAQDAVAATCTALNTPVGCNTGTAAVAANVKSTYKSLGANYTMGDFKVLYGYGKGDNSTPKVSASGTTAAVTAGEDSKFSSLGASYTMGATTFLVGTAKTKLGTAADRKVTGMRIDYALSKRTTAYLVNEGYNTGATSANKINTTAVGVRHSF